jgi:outer membrane protein assembly factor BamB
LRNDQHRTIAVDTATGRQAWSVPVEWSDDENWYVADGVLLFGEATFGPVVDPRVLRADGTVLRTGERGSRAVAARDGRAAVQTATATAAGEVVWQVAVTDLRTGRTTAPAAVGADLPDRVALGGDLLAVVTADRRLRVLRATGLD